MSGDEWWSKQQACDHLGVLPRRFEKYVAGGMPVVKIGRQVFVRRSVVQAEYRKRRLATKETRAKTRSAEDVAGR
jgi:hypothetical protein